MTFVGPSMEPPEPYCCTRCEDRDDIDHGSCIEAAEDARADYLIDQAEMRRDDERDHDDGPPIGWEP